MSKAITVLVAGDCDPAGEIDLLETVFWGFLKNPKGTRFEVPTADPSGLLGALGDRFQLWPVGARPLPTIRSMRRTDLVLLAGSLGARVRPTLAIAMFAAKSLARPLVAYGIDVCGDGGSATRRWLLGRCDEIIVRDRASEAEARRSGGARIAARAEPTFHLRGAGSKVVGNILGKPQGERLGIELDALARRGLDPAAVVRAVAGATGVVPILLSGQAPGTSGAPDPVLRRGEHRAETWTGILGALDLFVGERPAWLLRSVAMGVPVLALGDGKGVAGVLEDLGLSDLRSEDTAAEGLTARTAALWRERGVLGPRVRAASALGREAARAAGAHVSRAYLGAR